MNNTVTKEVLDSLGGIKDTIRPIQGSLTTHEMRPYEIHFDYRQTLQQVKREDEQSVRASMNCLRGDFDSPPKPLYVREGDGDLTDGANMIGKARLVSASPFRATLKVDRNSQGPANDSDEEFEREDLPELQKAHESPIKDDSEVLRLQRTDLLHAFSQSHSNLQAPRANDGLDTVSNRSEGMSKVIGGDLKGIMVHHETRTHIEPSAHLPTSGHQRNTTPDAHNMIMDGDESTVIQHQRPQDML
mmetsp:Transcript_9347/g.12726  ORF Transcript_9347/g.12726 Transcript_9347/m.12726 type:complete len:245 (+) Transcript_9347:617-1351(+)|eukprot:CAMPEP_0185597458 /NCGR_PEP_ID=MMETSP0434-20130131/81382_1 /TAXON_ID=626734 ORGANISM="Favella taraikaensis, Strain Fe Narragansett Bay" /NCGR_SAMPLE_ID=MMETSP0434 /ASSEMBLY_ACC=CAM_ASM_000379 /LENGTH=244 /DNA_ID=CAMNT_0028226191 /DNA_START=1004 /DNA_END=1738 /DNA_ORIENTATION=-